ncbi:hypothetical protein BDR06DRAFT_985691 [Suillus hirtellus]|nr:hypothetical protein BDR06DRAFT_985691 [Suillus hirtellus]
MHFLNKVQFSMPMNPLKLEMHHQINNVIGINPTFFEYLFMVNADAMVEPYSVNRLISVSIHDKKVLGVCGGTELANPKYSIITMVQAMNVSVYKYFISHHMAKAFESLFRSVTCLPGCFTLYRLWTPNTHKPSLISNQMIQDYSQNCANTLHMKNLINSMVHNLGELMFLEQLCGFCCFSMGFVIMIDLVCAIIQPITVGYIMCLIVEVAIKQETLPVVSLVMIDATYGLQAPALILRCKWDMVGWMFFYILVILIFSLMLPLYLFWRVDDFSWGATHVMLGESGKKIVDKFDPCAIPLKCETYYEPCGYSPVPLQFGMISLPGYQSGCNTPMSQLWSMSNAGMFHEDMNLAPGVPNNAELDYAVHEILCTADLNFVMKHEIQRQLEE